MLQFKKISVNLALVVSLVAFAGVDYAQAENIDIPLPSDAPEIQAVVDSVKTDVDMNGIDVKTMMRQTRDKVKVVQAQKLPLRLEMGKAISDVVSRRVREETRSRTMQSQMAAMQDPANPQGVPDFIAPKFE
ncbi:hypothetical protein VU01_11363 [Candidatus Electrothrix marina]|uniref:Uncharacterized protein n=1 Tax=Candidatus Electrothrix marina TaxID=1859130 RepID=A0A444JEJ0_9BACT|nr:hypothetical protein VU01_11363 [Candidatus Electrothrix marina]